MTIREEHRLDPVIQDNEQQSKLSGVSAYMQLYDETKRQITDVTANYTMVDGDHTLHIDASGGAVEIELPLAADVEEQVFYFKRTNATANAVTIDPNGTEQIDAGGAGVVYTLPGGTLEGVALQSDGTAWWTVSNQSVSHLPYTTQSSTYTITLADNVVLCDGTWTATLPTAASAIGQEFHIKNIGTGVITLDGDSAETIDSAATQDIDSMETLKVFSDGTEWWSL